MNFPKLSSSFHEAHSLDLQPNHYYIILYFEELNIPSPSVENLLFLQWSRILSFFLNFVLLHFISEGDRRKIINISYGLREQKESSLLPFNSYIY